jgi:LacI family transcriptional regulator
VDYAVDRLTELAVDRLLGLMQATDSLPDAEVTLIEPELVLRESSLGG